MALNFEIKDKTFRHSAGFGKRIEHYIVSLMLKEGLDVFLPMVDDDAIDAVVKRPDGQYVEIQIKARSKDAKFGSSAQFSAITHEYRKNYWFVFYSEKIDKILIMSSKEFIKEAKQNKNKEEAKNAGKRQIWFNGKNTKEEREFIKTKFEKYVVKNFDRILNDNPDKE